MEDRTILMQNWRIKIPERNAMFSFDEDIFVTRKINFLYSQDWTLPRLHSSAHSFIFNSSNTDMYSLMSFYIGNNKILASWSCSPQHRSIHHTFHAYRGLGGRGWQWGRQRCSTTWTSTTRQWTSLLATSVLSLGFLEHKAWMKSVTSSLSSP